MSPYKPFRTRRWIHHFLPVRLIEQIWMFFSRSSGGIKIVMVAIICAISGLFFPWIQFDGDSNNTLGAFSLLCGGIGWWISIILIVALISLFSYDLHQKIIRAAWTSMDPKTLYFRIGYQILMMTIIVSICISWAARSVDSRIVMTTEFSGMIMMLVSGILFCIGWHVIRKTEDKQVYKHIFVQGIENEDTESYKKILGDNTEENMKLPI